MEVPAASENQIHFGKIGSVSYRSVVQISKPRDRKVKLCTMK